MYHLAHLSYLQNQQMTNWWYFLIFPWKQVLTFHANCFPRLQSAQSLLGTLSINSLYLMKSPYKHNVVSLSNPEIHSANCFCFLFFQINRISSCELEAADLFLHLSYTAVKSFYLLGPVVQSVVSLTSSLRVILLTVLTDSIYNILIFFAEKIE